MVTVEEAKSILMNSIPAPGIARQSVISSLGFVLAEDVISKYAIPLFSQSAVDGFAICMDLKDEPLLTFPVIGELKAGDPPIKRMKPNSAIRIFTGAPVPADTFCVVMQERTILRDGIVTIEEGFIKAGSNIRVKGNQLKKGDCGLQKGIVVSPAAIGFLCGIGCTEIKVFRKPKIGILTTGNELVTAGKKLKPGQIYESNQATLSAALMQSGYSVELKLKAKDKKELVKDAVKKILSACDVLIISGGISVGKYDFVKDVLTGLSVKELFYKVSQKPGKPLFVGKKGKQLIFAVPGNPAAALVCFYQYVLPALNKLSGFPDQKSSTQKLKSELMYSGKGDRSLFLKAIATQEKVRILDGQDSDNLQSFAKANALVYLPKDQLTISEGEIVDVFLFPEI